MLGERFARRWKGARDASDAYPEAPATGEFTREAAAGQSVTVTAPIISKELRTPRIPVQVTPTDVQYVADAQWSDTPDKLFANLVAETIRRRTNRIVLDP